MANVAMETVVGHERQAGPETQCGASVLLHGK